MQFPSRPIIMFRVRPLLRLNAISSRLAAHQQQCCRSLAYIPMSPPPLFDLCVRRSFDEALERAQSHPHEAQFKHPRNWTALHCCVEHVAPIAVVKAIYQAHPDNVRTKDWQGLTPVDAAVDIETKNYLRQEFDKLQRKVSAGENAIYKKNDSSASSATIGNANDPMLLGKIFSHADNLSDQLLELQKTTKQLEKEITELKATLQAFSSK